MNRFFPSFSVRNLISTLFLLCLLVPLAAQAQEKTLPYQNPDLPIEKRIDDLLGRMTVKEKIGQMTLLNNTLINKSGESGDIELDPEKARYYINDEKIGFFHNGEAVPAEKWYRFIYDLQKIAVEESRLGIPIIYGMDNIHGPNYVSNSTIFPQSINIAATFNTEHAREAGRITALETASLGQHWTLAPVLGLGRNPYWPRFYETFGEDPLVASRNGSAYVEGLQNAQIGDYHQAATAKHFLGYSVPNSGWDRTPANIPDQELQEFLRPSFQAAVDAGVKTVMLNSSEINRVPVHASREIVTDLLRKQMGFDGVIVTDWDDIGKLVNYHKVAENYTEATLMSIRAGIDMSDTPLDLRFNNSMMELYQSGRVSEARIDSSVRRILRLKFELGLFEHPYPTKDYFDETGKPEHQQKALDAARESLVLLKNRDHVLPLEEGKVSNLLVVGPAANSRSRLSGGWTLAWQGGAEDRYPESVETVYSALNKTYRNADIKLMEDIGEDGSEQRQNFDRLAAQADAIVIAAGEPAYAEAPGNINNLMLPDEQFELIKAADASGKPTVLIMIEGRPRVIKPVVEEADAILFAGLPGFEGGRAIAEVISGAVNPSGKLPFTYPGSPGHFMPYNHPYNAYSQPPDAQTTTAQWPFGYGLSYTTFNYSNLALSDTTLSTSGTLQAEVTVTNNGEREGREKVLWYINDDKGTIIRPVKELAWFEPITLQPGESKTVRFTIQPEKHLSYPDFDGNTILEKGDFYLMVGGMKRHFVLTNSNEAAGHMVLD